MNEYIIFAGRAGGEMRVDCLCAPGYLYDLAKYTRAELTALAAGAMCRPAVVVLVAGWDLFSFLLFIILCLNRPLVFAEKHDRRDAGGGTVDSADDEGDGDVAVEKSGGGSTGGLSHLEKQELEAISKI